jgi:hypothetical protein
MLASMADSGVELSATGRCARTRSTFLFTLYSHCGEYDDDP